MSIIKECRQEEGSTFTFKRKLTEKNVSKITEILSNVDWGGLLLNKTADDGMVTFHNKLLATLDKIAPEKPVNVSTGQVLNIAWLTPGILKCSVKQLKLYKCSIVSKSPFNVMKYKNYQDVLKKIKCTRKKSFFIEKCNEFKNNSKNLWSMINNIIGKTLDKHCVINKLLVKNIEEQNFKIIINQLESNRLNMYLRPITSIEIEKIINNLVNKSCCGWDGLSNKLVKKLKNVLINPLVFCINLSFTEGVFPDCLKLAYVSPLFKSGKPTLATNYRPISLLPVLSKILKKQCMEDYTVSCRKHHNCMTVSMVSEKDIPVKMPFKNY